jgi:hypothetical protein
MPNPTRELLQRRLQALETIHGIAVITKYQIVIRCATLSITLPTGVLPRSRLGVCPSKIPFSILEHPCMIQTFKLLRHVVGDVPNSRAMTVVNLAIVPHLSRAKR